MGGVFISQASAKPFKLFGHDHDRDREEEAEGKVYIITDDPAPPGSTGIVHVVPASPQVIVPAPEARSKPQPQAKSRKSRSGETRYLEPVETSEVSVEGPDGKPLVVRKAEPVDEPSERVRTVERKETEKNLETPVKTSQSSSKKMSVQSTRKKAQQPEREDEQEAKTEVTSTKRVDRDDDAPPAPRRHVVETSAKSKHEVVEEEPARPKREVVEESTPAPVVHSNNPLMPNPAATEERKPLVPAEVPAPRQETTVTKEVTTSRTPAVEEAPPRQQVSQPEERVESTPAPEVPTLTAPSDFAGGSTRPRDSDSAKIAPANLPTASSEKTGASKRNSDIPVAEKTDKPGFVKTPFTPQKLIDVRGMASGSLAKDPSTNQVFRVP